MSASSFIVPYVQFQKEHDAHAHKIDTGRDGYGNLAFFLGVGVTSFIVWVGGSGAGFGLALGFPAAFDEALKFILPGYFAGLLVVEMKSRGMALVCLGSLLAALPGALMNPDWGWLIAALAIATVVWGVEQWA